MKPLFLFVAALIVSPVIFAETPDSEEDGGILIQPVSSGDVKKLVNAGTFLTLADVVPAALKNNLGIAVSRTNHEGTQELLEIADADFDPTFSFSSNYGNTGTPWLRNESRGNYSQNWANEIALSKKFQTGTEAKIYGDFNRQYNLSGDLSPASGAAAGFEITQHLMRGFGSEINLASVVRARKNIRQSSLNLRKTTLDLIHDTELAYWNLSASYALVFARLSSLKYSEFVLEQVNKKRALKSATKEDVLRAEADVASRRVAVVSARQTVQNADDALRKLLGEDGTGTLEVYQTEALPENAETQDLPEFQNWIKSVREFDIDSQVREIEREKAELDETIARDNDRPTLDLTLGAQVSGKESSPAHALGGVVDRTGYDLSAGVRFSMPIGFRASKAELRRARRSRESAEIEISRAVQTAMFDARNAWRAAESARERLNASKTSLNVQHEAFKAQLAKYNVGACSITDVLSAQNQLDSARLDLIQAAYDVATAKAKIHRLDGRILSDYGFFWEE